MAWSAKDEQRKIFEQLMGVDSVAGDLEYTDDKVCRPYLCGLCPYELLDSTKISLGACPKVHAQSLKDKYEAEVAKGARPFTRDFIAALNRAVNDVERKIANAQTRLDAQGLDKELMDRGKKIQDTVEATTNKVMEKEALEADGKTEEAAALNATISELQSSYTTQLSEFRALLPEGGNQQMTLRVCGVCGSMLSILDNDVRLGDHFRGRQHVGMNEIRKRLKALSAEAPDAARGRESSRGRDDGDRRGSRERSRERSRSRGRDDKDRDYDRRRYDDRRRDYPRDYDRRDRYDDRYDRRRYDDRRRDYGRDYDRRY